MRATNMPLRSQESPTKLSHDFRWLHWHRKHKECMCEQTSPFLTEISFHFSARDYTLVGLIPKSVWYRPDTEGRSVLVKPQAGSLSLMLLALVTDVDYFGMTITLDSFIHIEEVGGGGEFPKLAEAIVPRVELRGLLDDIAAHRTQMSPPTIVGSRLKSASEKSDQFAVSLQFIGRFGFPG